MSESRYFKDAEERARFMVATKIATDLMGFAPADRAEILEWVEWMMSANEAYHVRRLTEEAVA